MRLRRCKYMNGRCKDASVVLNPITRIMGPTRILYAQAKSIVSRLTESQIHSSEQANRFLCERGLGKSPATAITTSILFSTYISQCPSDTVKCFLQMTTMTSLSPVIFVYIVFTDLSF
jgi:hypothetical protein